MAIDRPFAVVTGGSSGIGFHLARLCAARGFDVLLAADEPGVRTAAEQLRRNGVSVETVECDLATSSGVDALLSQIGDRPVEILCANAGHGLGGAFVQQDFAAIRHVLNTNITGTLALLYQIAPGMAARGRGRILITGSIAGFLPGSFQAVYNGTKAFIDSFALALRNELKDTGVTVTCLMPGATDTNFFARADMLDTRVGQGRKDDPADVAQAGFDAMLAGEADVIAGLRNKMQVALARVTPGEVLAEKHRKSAEPGSAKPG
jgi:short-subunit dehydrogenase